VQGEGHLTKSSFVIVQDITERIIAQKNLIHSQELLKKLSDNVSELFVIFDSDVFSMRYISKSYEKMYGRRVSIGDSINQTLLEGTPHDFQVVLLESLKETRNGRKKNVEFTYNNPQTNKLQHHRMSIVPIHEKDNSIRSIAAVITDVTSFKEASKKEKER